MMTSRRHGVVAAGVALASALAVLLPVASVRAATPVTSASFTKTATVSRTHLVAGQDVVAETRTVTLSVSATQNLRDRQGISVSWTGAHPTGGILADQNGGDAYQEEYPMVLLECRGVDSTSVPVSQRLDPSTCWTQTYRERFQSDFNSAFPPWRVDRYATAANRGQIVGAPTPRPTRCSGAAAAEYWVPFVASGGTSYAGGVNGCAGMAPEAANVGGLALPSNTTYGVTNLNGQGSAKFDIWTAEDNASLGCSQTVACSLVAVPVMGISCDAAAAGLPPTDQPAAGAEMAQADTTCEAKGHFAPGQLVSQPQGTQDVAVSGGLWWSASNWRNRFVVPLTFAAAGNVCDLVSQGNPLYVYGSELMTQATTQWAPAFCLNRKLFRFKHVQTGEPQARNLLIAGGIEAAFISRPPPGGYLTPTVNSPVAATGFAISYAVDDKNGNEYTSLKLTPRLLAKLLTESYPALPSVQQEYAALGHNPLDMSRDPEFQALNPRLLPGVAASVSASTILSLSSDSDVIYALTSYINTDPDARKWLDGTPDPWGMVVNPTYKGIQLPVDSWPLLDTFEPQGLYQPGLNDCLHDAPVPFLPLIAAPISRLASIGQALQYAIANSQIVCSQPVFGTTAGEKLVSLGRQTPGFRFMLGVTSLADARRYQLDTASLQTTVSSAAAEKFTDATGRSFAGTDNAALAAAAKLAAPDTATGTWNLSYSALRSASGAYPGTMLVYASVPTSKLPTVDAQRYAQLLRYFAGAGQQSGLASGQLPPGYLPMTAANGLGALATYADAAATAVAAQKGVVPPLLSAAGTTDAPTFPLAANGNPPVSLPSSAATGSGVAPPAAAAHSAPKAAVAGSATAGTKAAAPTLKSLGLSSGQHSSASEILLVVLLILLLLGPVLTPVIIVVTRRQLRR
jgi:hypothetical protein